MNDYYQLQYLLSVNSVNPLDAALIIGAATRLTRLTTTDDIGQWWVKYPIYQHIHNTTPPDTPQRARALAYYEGLNCPHCVSFRAALAVTLSYAATTRSPRARAAWRILTATLTTSTIAGHVSARI